ncbi:MAG: type IV pilus modification protein PilV [Gammaproteobacteria bacterium]|nr:type IV pilus modification protein PilV [Gammaproteobacteria bacterium]
MIHRARNQRGLTLIEILVTLLVLSVGLMGLAALQGFSLQAGQISYLRTQATNFAYEVADDARANRSVVAASGSIPNEAFWEARAAELLPGGTVDFDVAAGGNAITVTVSWTDDRETGEEAEFTIATRI